MTDFLIIGAGTAGSVLTRRLLDEGHTVTLVEAGQMDENPAIHDLSRVGELWFSAEDWAYFSQPQSGAQDRRLHIPRGKVVGGSGQLNGTIWTRGAAWDYDSWAERGNTGWSWAEVEPHFERVEQTLDRVTAELTDIQQAIFDAAVAWGMPPNDDYNDGTQDGVSKMQLNLRDGRRLSTWAAFLRPVLDHPNLRLHTGAVVEELAFEGDRVIGARISGPQGSEELRAERTVLCAGALSTPQILQRSGIGAPDQLAGLGIEVRADLPGVGQNLQDHFLVPVIFGTERPIDPPQPFVPVTQTHWFWRSDPELPVPDTQAINFSIPFYYDEGMTGPPSGFTLHAGLVRPHSTGSITITGTDPLAEPEIDFGLYADPRDLDVMAASVRQCLEVGQQSPLADQWGARCVLPGADVDSDEAIRQWCRRAVNTYHHQSGTARMGTDELAVVTPELAVRGVPGLWVADASVFPFVPTGNTNAPTAMVADMAADLLGR